jgi:tRNA nucleotidyltransferase (CCA-adding enzyme)
LARDLATDKVDAICARLKIPGDCRDLAVMAAREQANFIHATDLTSEELVCLLERCDVFRKPQRFVEMLLALSCDCEANAASASNVERLKAAMAAAQSVNAGQVAQAHAGAPQGIAQAVHAARVDVVRQYLAK